MKSPAKSSKTRVRGSCRRTDLARPRSAANSSEVTQTTGRTSRQTKSRRVNRQTNRVGGNAPESNDVSQRLACAAPTQTEQTSGRGAMCLFHKTDTQQPTHLTHTACNEWRRGCLPQGIKKKTTTTTTQGIEQHLFPKKP